MRSFEHSEEEEVDEVIVERALCDVNTKRVHVDWTDAAEMALVNCVLANKAHIRTDVNKGKKWKLVADELGKHKLFAKYAADSLTQNSVMKKFRDIKARVKKTYGVDAERANSRLENIVNKIDETMLAIIMEEFEGKTKDLDKEKNRKGERTMLTHETGDTLIASQNGFRNMNTLEAAKAKLLEKISYHSLPCDRNDPLWGLIKRECSLTFDEMDALQNAACHAGKFCHHLILFYDFKLLTQFLVPVATQAAKIRMTAEISAG